MMSYEVMVAAVSGDPVAMQKVLAYFDGYMDQLCTHAFLDESGRVEYGVDTLEDAAPRKAARRDAAVRAVMRRWAHGREGHTRMGEVHAHHRGSGPVFPHRRGQAAPPCLGVADA